MTKANLWHHLRLLDMREVPRQIRNAAKKRYRLPPLAEYEKLARKTA
jgi:hypothetical protein